MEKQLGVPKCIYKHYPNTPHSYNDDNFGRLSLRILRLGKRAFGPYGPPIMRVGHVAGYGVKSNVHIGSSKLVHFTWDTTSVSVHHYWTHHSPPLGIPDMDF